MVLMGQDAHPWASWPQLNVRRIMFKIRYYFLTVKIFYSLSFISCPMITDMCFDMHAMGVMLYLNYY
jgi:hypothetical protein